MPEEESSNPFDIFPAEVQQDVHGLLWLGHIEETFKYAGHRFTLRTLRMSEELEADLVAKEYLDTIGQMKAHTWAQAAAALVAVDDDPGFCPGLGPDPDTRTAVRRKCQYMMSNWYWPVGVFLFARYTDLLEKQAKAMEALDNLSQGSLDTSWPLPDSSKTAGYSEENLDQGNENALPIL